MNPFASLLIVGPACFSCVEALMPTPVSLPPVFVDPPIAPERKGRGESFIVCMSSSDFYDPDPMLEERHVRHRLTGNRAQRARQLAGFKAMHHPKKR